jgi:deazaflavin-dependent oxidoreductase (nitroreductase family)
LHAVERPRQAHERIARVPLTNTIARANRYITNPIIRTFAGRIPPFAILYHRGRTSGRVYQTPIMVFPTEDGFIIALTYGTGGDWQKNVFHAGGCYLRYKSKRHRLDRPEIVEGAAGMAYMPAVVRFALTRVNVDKFLRLREAAQQATG